MKRIVICADGTWNERDQKDKESGKRRPTNVTKVARTVLPRSSRGIDQVVFYNDGVGTQGGIDKYTGGAFGHGIEDNVRALYRCVLYNYLPGDELYFFGFSRGAFTVRTLAGFMNAIGLIEKDDDYYLPEIYGCYERSERPGSPGWAKAFRKVQGTRPCPPIRFVGVWDTVGALGAPGLIGQLFNKGKYKYHDVGLTAPIDHAYQALAIDERRKPFRPNVWQRPAGWNGTLEQAWFPGVHSNVGGSQTPDGLANEALHWLVEKAERLGLEFDLDFLAKYRPCFNAKLHESMTTPYRLLGMHVRTIGQQPDEVLHRSALDRWNHPPSAYEPQNLRGYLDGGGRERPTANTGRIPRGQPCEDLPGS